jgi:hypothetical protein
MSASDEPDSHTCMDIWWISCESHTLQFTVGYMTLWKYRMRLSVILC